MLWGRQRGRQDVRVCVFLSGAADPLVKGTTEVLRVRALLHSRSHSRKEAEPGIKHSALSH